MLRIGSRIQFPKSDKFFKKYINQKNGNEIYSFFYNIGEKNEDGVYITKERYVIEILNFTPQLGEFLYIDEIISVEPKISKDKNGKEYLNIFLWIKCSSKLKTRKNNNQNENDLEITQESFKETNDTLMDYADFI